MIYLSPKIELPLVVIFIVNITENQTEYKLLLWDTSGQDKFRNLTYQYIKKTVVIVIVIVIVYDITNINSVNNIYLWIEEAKKTPKPI